MAIDRRTFLGATLSASALAGCTRANAGPRTDPWHDLDRTLRRQGFSGAVLAVRGDRTLLRRGYGLADRTRRRPNTTGTRFCGCSLGKMFTAVAIAQLAQRHRLSFQDTIGRHLPGFPADIADRVTVAQLLTHTSGMGDVLARTPGAPPPPTTIAGMLRVIARTPLSFPPGARFGYSNSGFVVLGAIVERLGDRPYADHVARHVFASAGMTDTAVRLYRPAEVPGMAHPYALVGPDGAPTPPDRPFDAAGIPQIGNPSGGAYTTVTDLVSFARALLEHRLLSPAMTRTVLAGKVSTADPARPPGDRYAYGFDDVRIHRTRIVGHNGGVPGYEGQLDVYPDSGHVVAMLANTDRVLVPAIRASEDILT